MKLQQLRTLVEITRHNLNISEAAKALCTSQPGVSKQVKLLEQELYLKLFARNGKNIKGLTPAGEKIVALAVEILNKVDDINQVAEDSNRQYGAITIATTHTQARYILPGVVKQFMDCFPGVALSLQQGTPMQVARQASIGEVDLAIATEAVDEFENLITMPCYSWNRCVLVRKDHPLANKVKLKISDIVDYPLITYVYGYTGRYKLDEAFNEAGLTPNIVLTAVDADVIKTYVKTGMGVGIVANMAFDVNEDKELVSLDAGHLFGSSITYIAIRRDKYIRKNIYKFIETFAPHLNEEVINKAMSCPGYKERKRMFEHFDIPSY